MTKERKHNGPEWGLHLLFDTSFAAWGRKVEKLGGTWSRYTSFGSHRFVDLPATKAGEALADQLIARFGHPTYNSVGEVVTRSATAILRYAFVGELSKIPVQQVRTMAGARKAVARVVRRYRKRNPRGSAHAARSASAERIAAQREGARRLLAFFARYHEIEPVSVDMVHALARKARRAGWTQTQWLDVLTALDAR